MISILPLAIVSLHNVLLSRRYILCSALVLSFYIRQVFTIHATMALGSTCSDPTSEVHGKITKNQGKYFLDKASQPFWGLPGSPEDNQSSSSPSSAPSSLLSQHFTLLVPSPVAYPHLIIIF